MKRRTIIGVIFIVAALLKLATLWGILHWSWFETTSEGRWAMYFNISILIYVGVNLVIDSYRRDPSQWLQRPVPPAEEGKRICCSVHYGGDEYVYRGETFHGARLDVFCGGIRLDLREAVITEDEEIDIHTFMGGVELIVPDSLNVETKSRSFIGGVGNETNRNIKDGAPCLHIVASNFLGGVSIKNFAVLAIAIMMCTAAFAQNDSLSMDTTLWYNQTQQLDGVVVKGRLPKTRVKGDGLSFQNSTQFMYQYGGSLNDNFTANYRTGGLDVTGSFWVGTYNHYKGLQVNDMLYYVGPNQVTGHSTQEIRHPWHAWSPQLQLNYMVNENHTFGAYYKYDRTPSGETKGDYLTDMFENSILTERSASYIWQDHGAGEKQKARM